MERGLCVQQRFSEGAIYRKFPKNSAGKTRTGTPSRFGSGKDTTYNAHEKGALPRDVIKISALAGGAGSRERVYYCKSCDALIEGTKAKKMCREKL